MSISSRGLHSSVGIPGTGISVGGYAGGIPSRAPRQQSQPSSVPFKLTLKDDGTVAISDEHGNPHPPRIVKLLRDRQGERLERWLVEQCDFWNKGIEKILNCHLDTPAPNQTPGPVSARVIPPPPASPRPRSLGLLDRIFKSRRAKIESENAVAASQHQQELLLWKLFKTLCAYERDKRSQLIQLARSGDCDAMQEVLDLQLQGISWPRETLLSFEIPSQERVCLDVDLPEIEDLPTEQASVAGRGLRINIKPRSDTQRRKEYVTHIHAVAFRLTGEVFASLPTVSNVIISGFSQRPDKATGRLQDEYLLSATIGRSPWEMIDFKNLASLDLPEVFSEFQLRRKMTKNGILSPIEPFDKSDG